MAVAIADVSFEEAVDLIGLGTRGLKLEGFRTDGTSNYLANLNYHGQTWAAALRMPASGASLDEFLEEKLQALEAVTYLIQRFKKGLDVGFNCVLKFGGVSTLVESGSTQAFLRRQHRDEPLLLLDRVGAREKRIEGLKYPESLSADAAQYITSYAGPFYISRGAPAWETLEEYPELEEAAAHALAILHLRTGSGDPFPQKQALSALEVLKTEIIRQADAWTPAEDSKESAALAKSIKKWAGAGDKYRSQIIKRERFLRTSAGRAVYRGLFDDHFSALVDRGHLHAFCHGDSHGGNYIVVRYQYQFAGRDTLIDRVFLNQIFEHDPTLHAVRVTLDESHATVTFDRHLGGADASDLVAIRRLHHEIHPIDLDSGTGTTEETKTLHLYDALVFSISLEHITTLFATTVPAEQVLLHYYDGLLR